MVNEHAPDLGDKAAEAASDFFTQIFSLIETVIRRLWTNTIASFSNVNANRWTKVVGSVVFYLVIRPYIERFFKWLHDRERQKEKEKKEKEKAERGGKKAKVSANSLRGGEKGKVLGEVENTDDELEEDGEDELAQASGVPEWHGMARKRQKKYLKNRAKGQRAENLSEDQIMELLDWSEEETVDKKAV
ncbi:hypothetical protein N7539_003375 [Penicillium diatomitis]|uniref:Protein trafficking Pga2 n=1 Tax=Penicillium diatomitis TaxID=2819901 RepID=A0A9X0BX79_9EURO|nr:uncharacterized protein N7539_003375 [Penicillium diatomitis]KAJ5488485.1 hypothetical protein N7539_003375 [Penicillium diatomitis]